MRAQRIQKRQDEIAKELDLKNQEDILKTRKKNMGQTANWYWIYINNLDIKLIKY